MRDRKSCAIDRTGKNNEPVSSRLTPLPQVQDARCRPTFIPLLSSLVPVSVVFAVVRRLPLLPWQELKSATQLYPPLSFVQIMRLLVDVYILIQPVVIVNKMCERIF